MVEVFKTNVSNRNQAMMLIHQIHHLFDNYKANFDLDDCDCILRVESVSGIVEPVPIIELLKDYGFYAEALPDDEFDLVALRRNKLNYY